MVKLRIKEKASMHTLTDDTSITRDLTTNGPKESNNIPAFLYYERASLQNCLYTAILFFRETLSTNAALFLPGKLIVASCLKCAV